MCCVPTCRSGNLQRDGALALGHMFLLLSGPVEPSHSLAAVLCEAPEAGTLEFATTMSAGALKSLSHDVLATVLERMLKWPANDAIWPRVLGFLQLIVTVKRYSAVALAVRAFDTGALT